MELRTIDFSKRYFECGERKFTFNPDKLGFTRWSELQKINFEFGYSSTFQDMYKNICEMWELLNQTKFVETAVILNNMKYGIVSIDEKEEPAWRICALFINEEDENPAEYDEGKMRSKIDCWKKELDCLPFFQLASSLTPGWSNAYRDIIPGGSKVEAGKESSQ